MAANSNDAANEYFRTLVEWEAEGERTPAQLTYQGQPLVRIADTWVTPETAAEFLSEVA